MPYIKGKTSGFRIPYSTKVIFHKLQKIAELTDPQQIREDLLILYQMLQTNKYLRHQYFLSKCGIQKIPVSQFLLVYVFGFMQHGPDGKIYIWGGGSSFMHSVDFPNRIGIDCNVRQRAIQLPGICFGPSLYYPRYRLGPIDNSSCDTLGINNLPQALFRYDLEDTLSPLLVTFTDVSSYEPTQWHWDFGDGAMSQDTNPVHDYTLPGAYQVCLIVSNAYAADTFCRQVLVGISGIHELPALPQAQVMPNPFTDEIQIVLPALVGVSPRFELFDLYGRNIANRSLQDFETRLSLPGLPGGIYFWKLLWNGVQTQSGKLVKP